MDLEALACVRAEEQLEAGAWKRRERDETPCPILLSCAVPGCDGPVFGGTRRRICEQCAAKGLVAPPCLGCGGPLRRKDQTLNTKERRGYCQTCRADMCSTKNDEAFRVTRRLAERRRRASRAEVESARRRLAVRGIAV
jgi:hypothetical protein